MIEDIKRASSEELKKLRKEKKLYHNPSAPEGRPKEFEDYDLNEVIRVKISDL